MEHASDTTTRPPLYNSLTMTEQKHILQALQCEPPAYVTKKNVPQHILTHRVKVDGQLADLLRNYL